MRSGNRQGDDGPSSMAPLAFLRQRWDSLRLVWAPSTERTILDEWVRAERRWANFVGALDRLRATTGSRTLHRTRQALRVAHYVVPLAPFGLRTIRRVRGIMRPEGTSARVRIIANPYSGALQVPGAMEDLQAVLARLGDAGLPAELCLSERPGHATELAREAVRAGMEIVVAAGGDGTINDVIQALAGHATALGVIPLGTVNVWAREVGIPMDPWLAADVLVRGARRRVDLGRAGARYFLMMAGIGFDAEVARRVEAGHLKRLGLKMLGFVLAAGALALTERPARIQIRREGQRRATSALMIIIGNTRLYGGALTFTPQAVADDNWLDVAIVGGGGLLYRMGVLLRALLRRPVRGPRVRYTRVRSIRVESEPPLTVQVDGEVVGKLPMTFGIEAQALTVVVPRNAPNPLFQSEPLPLPLTPLQSER